MATQINGGTANPNFYARNKQITMKHKILTISTILICFFCVAITLYWYFYQDSYPEIFKRINITTAFILILVMLLPTIQQQLKNDKKENIFV